MGFGCGNHVGSPCTALKVMNTPRILMTTAMTAGANFNKRRIHAPHFQHHLLKNFPRRSHHCARPRELGRWEATRNAWRRRRRHRLGDRPHHARCV